MADEPIPALQDCPHEVAFIKGELRRLENRIALLELRNIQPICDFTSKEMVTAARKFIDTLDYNSTGG